MSKYLTVLTLVLTLSASSAAFAADGLPACAQGIDVGDTNYEKLPGHFKDGVKTHVSGEIAIIDEVVSLTYHYPSGTHDHGSPSCGF